MSCEVTVVIGEIDEAFGDWIRVPVTTMVSASADVSAGAVVSWAKALPHPRMPSLFDGHVPPRTERPARLRTEKMDFHLLKTRLGKAP
jgi:hypothetical protein